MPHQVLLFWNFELVFFEFVKIHKLLMNLLILLIVLNFWNFDLNFAVFLEFWNFATMVFVFLAHCDICIIVNPYLDYGIILLTRRIFRLSEFRIVLNYCCKIMLAFAPEIRDFRLAFRLFYRVLNLLLCSVPLSE